MTCTGRHRTAENCHGSFDPRLCKIHEQKWRQGGLRTMCSPYHLSSLAVEPVTAILLCKAQVLGNTQNTGGINPSALSQTSSRTAETRQPSGTTQVSTHSVRTVRASMHQCSWGDAMLHHPHRGQADTLGLVGVCHAWRCQASVAPGTLGVARSVHCDSLSQYLCECGTPRHPERECLGECLGVRHSHRRGSCRSWPQIHTACMCTPQKPHT